ncbi:MAG: hypothetical protein ABIH64_02445 [Nanoarchaeota archaeon]
MLVQSFSGIRGIYGKDLTEDTVRKYAYVFSQSLRDKLKREPTVVVGYDTRKSSTTLKNALLDSLFRVIDVGIMPIAAAQLAVRSYKADCGIVITASHNPKRYNGLKFLDKDGAVLRPSAVDKVIKGFGQISKIKEDRFMDKYIYGGELENRVKRVVKSNMDLIHKYSAFLKKTVGTFDNKRKVILDVNGGAGIVLKEIIANLHIHNIKLINNKKGEFKRAIEPNSRSLKYLENVVKKQGAEFAAGFDCDADRVEVILRDGTIVDGNQILALIADDILSKKKGTVVVNDATSNLIRGIAERHRCKVKEVEVGEINVVDEMLRLKSPVGGEGSNGGIIIPPSRCRDGILSLFYLLKIMDSSGKSLRELLDELPVYYSVQKKVAFKRKVDIRLFRAKLKSYYSRKGYKINETGGISGGLKILVDNDSFVWFRFSKTEANLLRIISDSTSLNSCRKMIEEAVSLL